MGGSGRSSVGCLLDTPFALSLGFTSFLGSASFGSPLATTSWGEPGEEAPGNVEASLLRLFQSGNIAKPNTTSNVSETHKATVSDGVVGPGGGGIHSHEEWVDLPTMDACERTLVRLIDQWCG